MLGRGGFSFKNEALDLAFRADSKKFSLFSGQSPVGVNGHFAEPHLDVISGELLARAGGGLGLTAIATPLAGILAFVDVGDRSEEHTSELQSLMRISYAVFCLQKTLSSFSFLP